MERVIVLDVLVVYQSNGGECDLQAVSQLSNKSNLYVTDCFQKAIQLAKKKSHHLIVFLTDRHIFPESWKVFDPGIDSPTLILTKVNRHHIRLLNDWIDAAAANQGAELNHALIQKSLAFIDQNLCESGLTLDRVASQVYISKFYYSRIFQNYVGVGFKEYVMQRRIERAKDFLDKGESVTNTCYLVGYNDLTHFSRVFKKLVGIQPSKYRRQSVFLERGILQ